MCQSEKRKYCSFIPALDTPSRRESIVLHDNLSSEMARSVCFSHPSEIPRELLIKHVLDSKAGFLVQCHNVTVQTLSGDQFTVLLDDTVRRTVLTLKIAIEKLKGICHQLQDIFLLDVEPTVDPSDESTQFCKLKNEIIINKQSTVLLSVRTALGWENSPRLLHNRIYRISGDNNSVATRTKELDFTPTNCVVVDSHPMDQQSGKHSISFRILAGYRMMLGVVANGVSNCECPFIKSSIEGWGMYVGNGSLWGNGKCADDTAGRIKEGQVLTLQLDTGLGTLKFWVDGHPHGHGYASGVAGSLRWGLSTFGLLNSVQIVPVDN
jgi:hypothetical protein